MKGYKRYKEKEDSPLHDEYCDCYDCYDPWYEDDNWSNQCDCKSCNSWWSHEPCIKEGDMVLYEKRKRREYIINSILDEDKIRYPELEELYKKMRNNG